MNISRNFGLSYKVVHRISISILSLSLILVSLSGFGQNNFEPDESLSKLIGKKENIGVVATYSVNGDTKWSGVAGMACSNDEIPFQRKTLTRIASIAKSFTAVAVMQLVEQELIDLDSSIDQYLKNLPKDKQAITVRQLLTHSSGIPQYQDKKEIENNIHYNDLDEAMQVFINRPLLFESGTKYFYTTYGYVVLGKVIEAVTEMTYIEYMNENIFSLSGMENTYVEDINESYQNKSCLYHNNGKKSKSADQNNLSNRIPGGGFISTIEDVLKFGNALLDEKLIKKESLEVMIEALPIEYDGNKYGMGWFLYGPAPNENLVIGHSGGQTGCTSQLMIIPKSKTVVAVLSNTSGKYPEIVTFASQLISYSESKEE